MVHGLRLLVPALLLTTFACAQSGPGAEPGPSEGRAYVSVKNQHALPMEVYATTASGMSHRMGTVNPGMSSQFFLPQNLIGSGSVHFEARPSGGGQPFRSGDVLLAPGSIVDFTIAPQLFSSTVERRH